MNSSISSDKCNTVKIAISPNEYTVFNPGLDATYFNGMDNLACEVSQNEDGTAVASYTFTDVKEGSFSYNAVLWAVDKGITKGVTDTTFEPNTTCTRAHIVTFLYRAV